MSRQELIVKLPEMGKSLVLPDGSRFRVAKQVTRNVLQQVDDIPFYVRFESSIRLSDIPPEYSKFNDPKTGEANLPDVADVVNLETGEFETLIINTVLGSELERHYPKDGYVGLEFGVLRTKSELDKRYKCYKIIELERVLDEAGNPIKVEKKNVIDEGEKAVDKARQSKAKHD